jgi:cellulose synthase/poly-beta-1,6-N-acetylglucosamine synthase-like glycosyltransferase
MRLGKMENDRIALFTTVYPEGMSYFSAWYDSVVQQTNNNFDIWIGCDRISRHEVADRIGKDLNVTWVESEPNESSIILRERAFKRIIGDYPTVIFVDSDDVLEKTRVASAVTALKHSDIYGCAMTFINRNGMRLGSEFQPFEGWNVSSDLPRTNIFGLSNTAYRTDILDKCLPFRPDCALLDWYIATTAWFHDARFVFDPIPQMLYRQHPNNIARCIPPFSSSQILTATTRVLHHYQCVLQRNLLNDTAKRDKIEQANNYVTAFHQSIINSTEILGAYVERLNVLPVRHIWWSCVAHPDLEEVWRT